MVYVKRGRWSKGRGGGDFIDEEMVKVKIRVREVRMDGCKRVSSS